MSAPTRLRWSAPRCRQAPAQFADLDRINHQAGRDFEACGPREALEQAHGLSHTRIHQIAHGDPTGAPQRAYQLVRGLTLHPETTPYPLIRGLTDLVEQLKVGALPNERLGPQLEERMKHEARSEGEENVAQQRLAMALGPLRAAGWEPARLRPADRMELVAALADWLDHARAECDHQLAAVGKVHVLYRRVTR